MYSNKLGRGIYTITNTVNNKMYVGYAMDIWDRLNGHKWDLLNREHGNMHLQNAVNKYGIENFLFEVLWECEENQLQSMENWWCNMLNTHNRKYGYNLRETGPHGNTKMPEESKERMRQSQLKRPPTTLETREKHKNRMTEIHKNMKSDDKKKIGKWLNKNQTHKNTAVIRLNIEGVYIDEYISLKEIVEKLNMPRQSVNYNLMGKTHSCNGYIFVKKSQYDPDKNYTKCVRKRIVIKYTVEGQEIETYQSITEAANANNIKKGNLREGCRRNEVNGYKKNGFIYKLKNNAINKTRK